MRVAVDCELQKLKESPSRKKTIMLANLNVSQQALGKVIVTMSHFNPKVRQADLDDSGRRSGGHFGHLQDTAGPKHQVGLPAHAYDAWTAWFQREDLPVDDGERDHLSS